MAPSASTIMAEDNNNNNNNEEISYSSVLPSFFTDEGLCDMTLQGTDGVTVKANRYILAARSKVFRQMLLGDFWEASSPIVKLGYEGNVLKAIVEYVCTDKVQILSLNSNSKKRKRNDETTDDDDETSNNDSFLDQIPTLISLSSATGYFNLPGLSEQVKKFLTYAVKEDPCICFSLLEACQGPTVPEDIAELALSFVRRNGRLHATASNVSCLSSSVLEKILQDDKMEMTELVFFKILQLWVEVDPTKRKSTGQSLLEKYISLDKIDPIELSTTVDSSGLVKSSQLAEAYKAQALLARDGKLPDFKKFRHCVWKKSRSDIFSAAGVQDDSDILDYPPMISGIHQWKMKLVTHQIFTHVKFGIMVEGSSYRHGNFWDQNTGWVVSRIGNRSHGGSIKEMEGRSLEVGQTGTMTLNLVEGSQENGTLTWRVEDGEEIVVFSNFRQELDKYPQGFLPAVGASGASKVRLLSIEKLRD